MSSEGFSDMQHDALAIPSYRKEKKAGTLVSPKDVTIIASVESRDSADKLAASSVASSVHAPDPPSTSYVTIQYNTQNNKKRK